MREMQIQTVVKVYDNLQELDENDRFLLQKACETTADAHAPYSNFKVGAALLLADGTIITGSNQENASLPVGICAEGVAFSAASATKPGIAIQKVAITIDNGGKTRQPVSPCGLCRQTILEYEQRFGRDIEILLKGEGDEVYRIGSVKDILPLAFTSYSRD